MDGNDEQWAAQLRKGSLELCMLALLARDERYGYQIAQGLSRAGGLVVSEGTIYPLLSRLQREGLVAARWHESPAGPPRKYYRLTLAGQQALEARAQAWQEFSQAVDEIVQEAHHARSTS